MGKRVMAKPIAARIVGKRASNAATSRTSGSSAPRKSKASGGPIDDMQYTAQAAKICAGIQDELDHGGKELLPHLMRLQRMLALNEGVRGALFVMPSPGDYGPLVDVLLASSPLSNAVLPALQAVASVTGNAKAALRLAKRGFGHVLIQLFANLRTSRDDHVIALLYACLGDIGVHVRAVGIEFASRGWPPLLADFINRKMRMVKMALPAIRAMSAMLNEESASAYAAVGIFSTTTRLVQVYSTQLRQHEILKSSLKLLGTLLDYDGTRPGSTTSRSSSRKLLQMLTEWIKLDVRRKHDDVRREIAIVLQRMVGYEKGRAAFVEVDGIAMTLSLIEDLLDPVAPRCENFISQLYTILMRCRHRTTLPCLPAPLLFKLPDELHDLDKLVFDDAAEPESDEEDDIRVHRASMTPRREHHPSATPFAAVAREDGPDGLPHMGRGRDGDSLGAADHLGGIKGRGDGIADGSNGGAEYLDDFDRDDDLDGLEGLDDCAAGTRGGEESGDSMGSDPESERDPDDNSQDEDGDPLPDVPQSDLDVDDFDYAPGGSRRVSLPVVPLATASSPRCQRAKGVPVLGRIAGTVGDINVDVDELDTDDEDIDVDADIIDDSVVQRLYSHPTRSRGRGGSGRRAAAAIQWQADTDAEAAATATFSSLTAPMKSHLGSSATDNESARTTRGETDVVVRAGFPPFRRMRHSLYDTSDDHVMLDSGSALASASASASGIDPAHPYDGDEARGDAEGARGRKSWLGVWEESSTGVHGTALGEAYAAAAASDAGSATAVCGVDGLTPYELKVDHLFPELLPDANPTEWPSSPCADSELVARVRTVRPCVDISPTPFVVTALTSPSQESLLKVKSRKTLRRRMLHEEMIVLQDPTNVRCRTVFDVDDPRVAEAEATMGDALQFESQFESGNLRTATVIHDRLYDLVLSPDINTMGHTQWFYFSVSNMTPGVPYRFNIVNLEKANSQFNFGMQPVMYSERAADDQGLGWHRVGSRVGYLKNNLRRDHPKKTTLFSATFTVTFKHKDDTCFLAYHYPFTYSDCQTHISELTSCWPRRIRCDLLCQTLGGNRCDLLTITSSTVDDQLSHPLALRKYIVLSARVHPGETNASWMMKGALDFLTSDDAVAADLRRNFVFKIVPMLNPDGVANGNHRCSLAGADLNRKWRTLHPQLHPTIAYTKMLFSFLRSRGITPELYCDFHGHSRRKMVFIYGCSADSDVTTFPKTLSTEAPQFSYKSSRFTVTDDKEGSARVAIFKEYGVVRSYTMESTFAGFDKGEYRGDQINVQHLEKMGQTFVSTILSLLEPSPPDQPSRPRGGMLVVPPTTTLTLLDPRASVGTSLKLPPLVSLPPLGSAPRRSLVGEGDLAGGDSMAIRKVDATSQPRVPSGGRRTLLV